jgi:hypothetical protein
MADPSPHWLEVAYWISQIVLTIIALIGAFAVRTQINEARNARVAQLRTMNAHLLMELDKRWDSTEMRDARKLYSKSVAEIDAKLKSLGLPLDGANTRAAWTRFLADCRSNRREDYQQLLLMPSFFETVGVMVKKEYIAEKDVIDLLAGPIIYIGLRFGDHIAERSQEPGVPKGLFENALNLYDKVRKAPG